VVLDERECCSQQLHLVTYRQILLGDYWLETHNKPLKANHVMPVCEEVKWRTFASVDDSEQRRTQDGESKKAYSTLSIHHCASWGNNENGSARRQVLSAELRSALLLAPFARPHAGRPDVVKGFYYL
jgi:hypothetical protein